jgi:hypothetical protein
MDFDHPNGLEDLHNYRPVCIQTDCTNKKPNPYVHGNAIRNETQTRVLDLDFCPTYVNIQTICVAPSPKLSRPHNTATRGMLLCSVEHTSKSQPTPSQRFPVLLTLRPTDHSVIKPESHRNKNSKNIFIYSNRLIRVATFSVTALAITWKFVFSWLQIPPNRHSPTLAKNYSILPQNVWGRRIQKCDTF